MPTPRASQSLTIDADGARLFARTELGSLSIDASGHALLVQSRTEGATAATDELGASQAGLDALADMALARLGIDPDDEARRLCEATLTVLRRAASDRVARLGAAERKINAILLAPHLYSAPFIRAEYLRKDALASHACRVAIALLQRSEPLAPTTTAVEAHIERLKGWRALFREGGTSKAVVNRLIPTLDEETPPDIVWALRRARLTQVPPSKEHLHILSALGAHARHADLEPHMELIERTEHEEILAALETTREHPIGARGSVPLPHLVAELIATLAVGPKTSLRRILRVALDEQGVHARDPSEVAEPPFGLPRIKGIRFLRTAAEIVEEGMRMGHCVGTRAGRALQGLSFIFHIDHEGQLATAEVNAEGRVLEIKGPRNTFNEATKFGERALQDWLRAFHARARMPLRRAKYPASTSIWRNGRAVPSGCTPLRTVGEAIELYERVMAGQQDMFMHRLEWLIARLDRAVCGDAYLTLWKTGGETRIRVQDMNGRFLEEKNWTHH